NREVGDLEGEVGEAGIVAGGKSVEVEGMVTIAAAAISKIAEAVGDAADPLVQLVPLIGNVGTAIVAVIIARPNAGHEHSLGGGKARRLKGGRGGRGHHDPLL